MKTDSAAAFFRAFKSDFPWYRRKKIFFAGGTGFFGKWLLTALSEANRNLDAGIELTVLSRNPTEFLRMDPVFAKFPGIEFITGDVRDFTFPERRYDLFIHAATEASAKLEKENPAEIYSVIVDGTAHALEFARKAKVERMLYISSGAVYGPQPPELALLPESFTGIPATAYGQGKLEAERQCLEAGIDTVIARGFAFVGPWLPLEAHFAAGNFLRDALANKEILIQGDGTPFRSYLYAGDLTIWLLRLLSKGKAGQCYNVGSDQAVSIRELAEAVLKASGGGRGMRIMQKPDPTRLPSRYVPDISKAETELGLRVFTPLAKALQLTLDFHRSKSQGKMEEGQ